MYAEEGVEVRVGNGDFSRSGWLSLWLLLMRRKSACVFWLSVRAGEGEVRDRWVAAVLLARRGPGRGSSGDVARCRSSSVWITVLLLDEPELYDRGLVILPAEDQGPSV